MNVKKNAYHDQANRIKPLNEICKITNYEELMVAKFTDENGIKLEIEIFGRDLKSAIIMAIQKLKIS